MAPAAPAPAAPAAAPADAQMPAAGEAPVDGALEQDEGGDESTALCTIMNNGDGTFTLIAGERSAEEPVEGEMTAPEGETFGGPGPLLKAVLDMIKAAEQDAGGGASANFNAGFEGKAAPVDQQQKQKYPTA